MSNWNPTSPEERERLGRVAHAAYLSRVPVELEDHLLLFSWEQLTDSQRETFRVIAVAVARDAVAVALREVERRFQREPHWPDGPKQKYQDRLLGERAVLGEIGAMLRELEAAP